MAVEAPAVLLGEVFGGDDHDRDRPSGFLLAPCLDQLKPVHLRHHEIEQDHHRPACRDTLQGHSPILGLTHVHA
jgi:hypothetical protein